MNHLRAYAPLGCLAAAVVGSAWLNRPARVISPTTWLDHTSQADRSMAGATPDLQSTGNLFSGPLNVVTGAPDVAIGYNAAKGVTTPGSGTLFIGRSVTKEEKHQ